MNRYTHILERQLAIDYGCSVDDVRSSENIFRPFELSAGARPVCGRDTMLKMAVYREKLLVMADDRLLPWCIDTFGSSSGTWLSEPENLIMLNNALGDFGQTLADAHHHYIPAQNFPPVCRNIPLRFFEQEEIERFRGDGRFWEALLFDERTPDMLAVCAMDGETILGMASVTRDTGLVWQIGVNVTDEGKGKGIGSYVTAVLKEEVLGRGILPTYATVESHIKSQKVAFRSGFEPAFYEIFSK